MTCPFRGGYFTASPGDPDLLALAVAGNSVASSVLSPAAASFLVARPAEGTGLGLYLRDQCSCPHEITLAAYWGHLTRSPNPASRYVCQYPLGSVPVTGLDLCVDAHNQCRRTPPLPTHAGLANHSCEQPTCAPHLRPRTMRRRAQPMPPHTPSPTHAGLANHSCEQPTCAPHLLRIPGCPLSVIVLRPRHSLRGGTAITYNYDAYARTDAFTISAASATTLLAAGRACFPCRCAAPLPCPRHRYFL